MTLTEDEILNIGEILGIEADYLTDHFTYRDAAITPAVETRVRALLVDINALPINPASFDPTESNEGFRLNGTTEERRLSRKLATLLYLSEYLGLNSGGQTQLVRG